MKRKNIYTLLACISLLTLASCSDEGETLSTVDSEFVTVKLTATVDSKEFATDSEIVPMRTTRAVLQSPYRVAFIEYYTLIILKQLTSDVNPTWAIEKKDRVKINDFIYNNTEFKIDITQCLRPGEYKFLLLTNLEVDNKLMVGSTFQEDNIPWLTAKDRSDYDIFFAIKKVTIAKKSTLDQNNDQAVSMKLERRSSLIRLAFDNSNFFTVASDDYIVGYNVSSLCSGLNLFGDNVKGNETISRDAECLIIKVEYKVKDKEFYFSRFTSYAKLMNLLFDDNKNEVDLTITKVSDFENLAHMIHLSTIKNKQTTVLLSKKDNKGGLDLQILEAPEGWVSGKGVPWEFIELNNNF